MKRVLPVRIPVYIDTVIQSNGKSYNGIIGNLSSDGAFIETEPTRTATYFMPGKNLKLKFQASSKKTVTLNCEVIWLYTKRGAANKLTNSLGLEIKAPTPSYKRFLQTL